MAAMSLLLLFHPSPWTAVFRPPLAVDDGLSVGVASSLTSRDMWSAASRSVEPPSSPSQGAHTHAHANAHAQGGEKYLVFFPHWGMSNQLLGLERAIVASQMLNRTLLLPDLSNHQNTEFFPYSALFDLDGLRAEVYDRIVEAKDFVGKGLRPGVLLRLENGLDAEPMWWERVGWGGLRETSVPVNLTTDMQEFVDWSNTHYKHMQVLGVNSMFFYANDYLHEPEVVWRMSKIVRLRREVQGAVDRAVTALRAKSEQGVYSCMHLRRGDFEEHCAFILDYLQKPDSVAKRKAGFSCYPRAGLVARNIREAGMADGSVIYVSTDNATALADAELRGLRFATSSDVSAELSPAVRLLAGLVPGPEAQGVMDQAVCAGARAMLLNAFSTFSDSVTYRSVGREKKVHYFMHYGTETEAPTEASPQGGGRR